jgi:hypothetical protein
VKRLCFFRIVAVFMSPPDWKKKFKNGLKTLCNYTHYSVFNPFLNFFFQSGGLMNTLLTPYTSSNINLCSYRNAQGGNNVSRVKWSDSLGKEWGMSRHGHDGYDIRSHAYCALTKYYIEFCRVCIVSFSFPSAMRPLDTLVACSPLLL